ncbi:gamma-glutamylcyclotransferase family protein [Paenibacillus sp. 1A_MP2]|uniref:gamma-glutamylcyclotransferase family protein n=1 Tax=Paenibacillus sp. 1A_MP2 TaxID=3457495 RepID=UPI003FCC759F
MIEDLVNVFVYGTLMRGERNHRVVKGHMLSTEPGTLTGILYNISEHYPALILDEQGFDVEGEWMTVHESALKEMDRLEGYNGPGKHNFYERVWVKDLHKEIEGWVYVWESSSKNIENYSMITTGIGKTVNFIKFT